MARSQEEINKLYASKAVTLGDMYYKTRKLTKQIASLKSNIHVVEKECDALDDEIQEAVANSSIRKVEKVEVLQAEDEHA